MKWKKMLLTSLFLLAVALSSLYAFSPTLLAGTSLEHITYSEADSALWYQAYGAGSWRTALYESGYLSVTGDAQLLYTEQNGGRFGDSESVQLTYGVLEDRRSTILEIGLDSSIDDVNYGTLLNPDWSVTQTFTLPARAVTSSETELYLRYSGEYLYQEMGSNDKTVHEAAVGMWYDPSIMRGYRLELAGTGSYWKEKKLFDSGGSETDSLRRDYQLVLEAEVNGLAGYFADWSLILTGGTLFSNGNYLTDLGSVQEEGFDAWFNGFEAEWSWSPSRSLQLSSSLYAEIRRFLHREALNDDGSLSGELLSSVDTGAQVEADWTPDDRIYFILSLFGGRTFSNDPNIDSWNLGLRASVEYGF